MASEKSTCMKIVAFLCGRRGEDLVSKFPYNGGKGEGESPNRQVTRYPVDERLIRIVRLVVEKWRKNLLKLIHAYVAIFTHRKYLYRSKG